jgi:peptide deformylase
MKYDIEHVRLRYFPDPALRQKAEPVTEFDDDLRALARRMFEIMAEYKGVGLAAPQVGVNIRMFVMNATGEPDGEQIIVNPEIHDRNGGAQAEEGCLSLPGVYVQVRRPTRCRLVAQNELGEKFESEEGELLARVWQHETDHLDGVLIIDKMGPTDRMATKKMLAAMEADFKQKISRRL